MQTPDGCTGLSASQKTATKEQKLFVVKLHLTAFNMVERKKKVCKKIRKGRGSRFCHLEATSYYSSSKAKEQ